MSSTTATSAGRGGVDKQATIPGATLCLVMVCMANFMLLLDATIVTAALADIRSEFDATIGGLQWVIDAYSLPLAGLSLTFAVLADRHGRKRVFLAGLAVFTGSSLALALSTSIAMLDVLRAVQGIGAAMLFAAALPLLAVVYPGREARLKAIGIYGAVIASATVAGPVVGGALVTAFGWRSVFLINVPVGAVLLVLAYLRMPESVKPGGRRTDWLGSVLLTGGLLAGVFALIRGNSVGWTSAEILGLLGAAAVLLIAFLVWQFRAADPMFDVAMARKAGFAGTAIVSTVYAATIMATVTYLGLYLMNTLGYTPLQMGLRLVPISLTAFLTAPPAAALSKRVPISVSLTISMVLVGFGMWLMSGIAVGDSWLHFLPGMIVAGVGLGGIASISNAAALSFAPEENAGMASATFGTFRQVGLAIGIAGLGALFSHTAIDRVQRDIDVLQNDSRAQLPGGVREQFVDAVGSGAGSSVVHSLPPQFDAAAGRLTESVDSASADALNSILGVGAVAGLVAAVVAALAFALGRRFGDSSESTH
ncbi:MFS transporter [Nocardia sp. NPDC051052]|uniref:MFS transporter n=1 Tax=Nocardia sp. NPDC051052 TaxID=3364322 RepID=UPI0037ABD303